MEQNPDQRQGRWSTLFDEAENAIDSLMSHDAQDYSSDESVLSEDQIEIELGRITFGPQERASVRNGTILPLGKPVSPNVTLWHRNQKIADAVLLVKNGRLALRITAIEE